MQHRNFLQKVLYKIIYLRGRNEIFLLLLCLYNPICGPPNKLVLLWSDIFSRFVMNTSLRHIWLHENRFWLVEIYKIELFCYKIRKRYYFFSTPLLDLHQSRNCLYFNFPCVIAENSKLHEKFLLVEDTL